MKKTLLVLAILSLATSQALAKSKEISNNASVGCTESDTVKKLYQYAHEKNTEAFKEIYLPAIAQGTCTKFKKGEKVIVVDSKMSANQVKVRREGDQDTFWIILNDIY